MPNIDREKDVNVRPKPEKPSAKIRPVLFNTNMTVNLYVLIDGGGLVLRQVAYGLTSDMPPSSSFAPALPLFSCREKKQVRREL